MVAAAAPPLGAAAGEPSSMAPSQATPPLTGIEAGSWVPGTEAIRMGAAQRPSKGHERSGRRARRRGPLRATVRSASECERSVRITAAHTFCSRVRSSPRGSIVLVGMASEGVALGA
jgi:hypothetical protein